jgi:hypothetical protein
MTVLAYLFAFLIVAGCLTVAAYYLSAVLTIMGTPDEPETLRLVGHVHDSMCPEDCKQA